MIMVIHRTIILSLVGTVGLLCGLSLTKMPTKLKGLILSKKLLNGGILIKMITKFFLTGLPPIKILSLRLKQSIKRLI